MEKAEVTAVLAGADEAGRKALRAILEGGGYTVTGEAADGVELIQRCEALRPTAVFLDVDLPCLDGLSAGAYLSREGLAQLMFFLADGCEEASVAAAKRLGAGGYLVKPASAKQLLPAFAAALSRHEAMSRVRRDCAEIEEKITRHRTLERAKCAVMEREGLSAQEAEAYLRRVAEEKGLTLLRVAEFFSAAPGPGE